MNHLSGSMHRIVFAIGTILCAALPSQAKVKLAGIFGDHMVLQQEQKAPIWGTADAGEKVSIHAGDHAGSTVAAADGKWRIDLPPFAINSTPITLTVQGTNTISLHDVLIGEVWLSSGQSNMEYCLRGVHNAKEVIPQASDPLLRIFYVNHASALEPLPDLTPSGWQEPTGDFAGQWLIADPKTVHDFSAVAYFFGRELRSKLNRPVGLIGCSFGGTVAQAWTSISGLQKDPSFSKYVEAHQKLIDAYPLARPGYDERKAQFDQATKEWNAKYDAGVYASEVAWAAAAREARAAGQPIPPRPELPTPRPSFPPAPDGGKNQPGNLFNGMVAPLIPYAIRGVIWYQGEFNDGAAEYRTLFPRLISDWREKWGQGDFPFLFVQLAAFGNDDHIQGGGDWALLQEAQSKALSLPKSGMATAVDIGDFVDIHPADKLDVGLRLALLARRIAYGEDIVHAGPTFEKFAVESGKIRVSFTNRGGGLVIGSAPWTAPNALATPTTSLLGFVIAGADQKFFLADAKIDGTTVVVSSPNVPNPVAVRYNFANFTQANLYNKEGLPAFPFRTDAWDQVLSPTLHPVMAPVPSSSTH
jgi:sialate O-acetylesterase